MGYSDFLKRIGQVNDLINAKQILAWDARTMMPPGGAETRAKQEATLTVLARDALEEIGRVRKAAPAPSDD